VFVLGFLAAVQQGLVHDCCRASACSMLAYPQACTPMSHQLLVKPNDVRHDRVLLLSLSLFASAYRRSKHQQAQQYDAG